jgi:hypothetical protein
MVIAKQYWNRQIIIESLRYWNYNSTVVTAKSAGTACAFDI